MKIAALGPALAALLLAGCGSYGSYLDRIGERPNPPVAMTDAQAKALMDEADSLRVKGSAVRDQLARETDRYLRFRHYRELRRIGDDLAPIERALRDAARPSRPATVQPVAARNP